MTDITFDNKHYLCRIFTTHVGGKAIKMYSYDGESYLQPTVWLSDLKDNEVAITDYHKTSGILSVLIDHKIIHPPHRHIDKYPVCYLIYEDQ